MTNEQQKRLFELVETRAGWPQFLGAIIKGMQTDDDPAMIALGEALMEAVLAESARQSAARQ